MIQYDHNWSFLKYYNHTVLNMTFDMIIDIIDHCLGWPWRVEGSERQAEHFKQGRTMSFREKDYAIKSRNKLNSSIILII